MTGSLNHETDIRFTQPLADGAVAKLGSAQTVGQTDRMGRTSAKFLPDMEDEDGQNPVQTAVRLGAFGSRHTVDGGAVIESGDDYKKRVDAATYAVQKFKLASAALSKEQAR